MTTLPRLALCVVLVAGCSRPADEPATAFEDGPLPDGPGTRVLFIGNSQTGYNHLHAVVQAMAKAGGKPILQRRAVQAGTSLQDHLDRGAAQKKLASEKWDVVVLQQGASVDETSRAELKAAAVEWGKLVRDRGAKPVLFMVWPLRGTADGFDLVSKSYREAGAAAGCDVFAAGEAWDAALKDDPTLPLYDPDGRHPAPAGSYLAGLIITHGLVGVRPDVVPAKLALGGKEKLEIPEEVAVKLRRAATTVIDRAAPPK
jgi:hypothetical protein